MVEAHAEDAAHCLREFFFLRHGARLDQLDAKWRASSPTPYDTPISKEGADQARLTGQSIALHSSELASDRRKRRRRYIIHSSPFLRCLQTSLVLASMLDADVKPLLRVDCWLGEWMTPDYYTDIAPPPPMPELASHALAWLRQAHISPPSTPDDSMMQQFKSLKLNGVKSPSQEAEVEVASVQVDWQWNASTFGEGGEYGEEWPEMHARFRSSLRQVLDYYATQEDVIVVFVTHGAGCNAMMGAVSGRPVLTDVGIASLSHAILRPIDSGEEKKKKKKIAEEYCLLMSASTQHLTQPVSMGHHAAKGGGQSTIGRSGSWHNNLGRTNGATTGLWNTARRESRHASAASVSIVPAMSPMTPVKAADETKPGSRLDPREVTRQRGRQRSFTVQACGVYNPS